MVKSQTHIDMMAYPVEDKMALSVAKMSDEKLVKAHFLNAFFAALGGKESIFWKLSAAMLQEMKRRSLKASDKLS